MYFKSNRFGGIEHGPDGLQAAIVFRYHKQRFRVLRGEFQGKEFGAGEQSADIVLIPHVGFMVDPYYLSHASRAAVLPGKRFLPERGIPQDALQEKITKAEIKYNRYCIWRERSRILKSLGETAPEFEEDECDV